MQTSPPMTPLDFKTARSLIESKDKSLFDKEMTLKEAVNKFVKEGDMVAIGGSLYTRPPMATIYEIIRQRVGNLSLSRGLTGFEADMLVIANGVRKVVTSWWSPGYAWGSSRVLKEYAQSGTLELEEWSHLAMALRFKAAAMGLTFLPSLSVIGSDLEKVNDAKEIKCPFTNEKVLLLPALYPNVGIIHAQRADKFGNVQIDGYQFIDKDIAAASSRVIVTTEQIVDSEVFRREPERTVIPFFCVDAVVEVPFGSYPGECWNQYEADFEHFDRYSSLVSKEGIDGIRRYIHEFVYSKASFEDQIQEVGVNRLMERRRAFKDVSN